MMNPDDFRTPASLSDVELETEIDSIQEILPHVTLPDFRAFLAERLDACIREDGLRVSLSYDEGRLAEVGAL